MAMADLDLLQSFISARFDDVQDRISEQREAVLNLSNKVDAGFALIDARSIQVKSDLVGHEIKDLEVQNRIDGRLTSIESMHKNLKWFARAAIMAALTMIGDLVVNHIPHWFAGPK